MQAPLAELKLRGVLANVTPSNKLEKKTKPYRTHHTQTCRGVSVAALAAGQQLSLRGVEREIE
jgi:hypothetical protein